MTPIRTLSVSNTGWPSLPERRQTLKTYSVETSRVFAPNASIALVGIRGCGKTSLGYIAARALGWRLIEADDEFERMTGLSRAQFLKNTEHNVEEYRKQERQVMESILSENERDAVIVCGIGSIESHGQMLLRKYALNHPVIHIVRETEYVREWLRIPKENNLVQRLEQSDRKHRVCSNFEFYNLFDGGSGPSILHRSISRDEVPGPGQRSPPYAGTLQRTQQDFIRFINLVMGFPDPARQVLGSKISAAAASPVDRIYTYALSVEFSQIDSLNLDITELECGADAVELEIDASDVLGQSVAADSTWITKLSKQFAILRREIAAPIIYHVNRNSFLKIPEECQGWRDEVYLELLHLGLRMGAEFVTVDIDFESTREILRVKGSTEIIGDYLDINPSQQSWDDPGRFGKYKKATQLRCDIVRMSQFASSDEDNIAIRRFNQKLTSLQGVRPPLIAYNVGRLGRASMCSNTILTTVTHPSLRALHGHRHHHALLSMQEASKMTYDLGLLDPLHFCIFGASIQYSLSPAMHNAGYQASGLPHQYKIRQSPSMRDLDTLLNDPSFGGERSLNSMSTEAQAIGAVNTIIPIKSPIDDISRIPKSQSNHIIGWHGDNTDWIGITTCVRRHLSPANIIRPWTSSLVLGAGGMARAAIYALIRLDVSNIFVCNRTISKAEKLAAHFNEVAASFRNTARRPSARNVKHQIMVIKSMGDPWPVEYEQPTIIVSCVPAHSMGSSPAANITLPTTWLQSANGGVMIELAYKPLITPLIAQIEELREIGRPWVPVNGLEVLPEQGIAQFQLLTGRTAPRHCMRAEVLRKYRGEEDQCVKRHAQR
ncbi:repressor protein [Bisporella sp. PMI_857]|nr:repressor protein [Bisporella sp. PMI_857]